MVNKSKRPGARRSRTKYIAFHNGVLVPDHILDYLIDAGRRGLMTKAGANLLLIPDTRHGPEDVSGLRVIGKFRKADCLTLKQLVSQNRRKSRLRQTTKNRSKKDNEISDIKTRKSRSGTRVSKRDFPQKDTGSDVA